MNYFVTMIDFGKRGREATVDPEITRREVVSRIQSGEYQDVIFVHSIHDGVCEDVTDEVMAEAFVETDERIDALSIIADHARDLRKHEVA